MAPPRGYPFTLSAQGEVFANGVIPKGLATVTATVKAVLGVTAGGAGAATVANMFLGAPNVYCALFAAPSAVGGTDGAEVAGTRGTMLGLTAQAQTVTATVPSSNSTAPAVYILRLWVDGLTGTNGVQVSDITVA
jgi:hypothetical protein